MAKQIAMIGVSSSSPASVQFNNFKPKTMKNNNRVRICSVSASATTMNDPYKTLRIRPDASKSQVKKAFRQLALQYHPDVYKGNNSGMQFHHINEAYDTVMSQLRTESSKPAIETYEQYNDETEEVEIDMYNPDLDLWEEWMGWEGAGIRDYFSHINPYL